MMPRREAMWAVKLRASDSSLFVCSKSMIKFFSREPTRYGFMFGFSVPSLCPKWTRASNSSFSVKQLRTLKKSFTSSGETDSPTRSNDSASASDLRCLGRASLFLSEDVAMVLFNEFLKDVDRDFKTRDMFPIRESAGETSGAAFFPHVYQMYTKCSICYSNGSLHHASSNVIFYVNGISGLIGGHSVVTLFQGTGSGSRLWNGYKVATSGFKSVTALFLIRRHCFTQKKRAESHRIHSDVNCLPVWGESYQYLSWSSTSQITSHFFVSHSASSQIAAFLFLSPLTDFHCFLFPESEHRLRMGVTSSC